ncbi:MULTISPECIES: ROK family transcriptional regulator [unclassified Rhizobium]|uniref:ROK family transcriptional regulator n=1 Tax=unclassified Rhizobium TaxID=2613769 RepID=UPI001FD74609|nr:MULTISPECIES: ROK family transcriptional regulator [unclassified Rhizobium]
MNKPQTIRLRNEIEALNVLFYEGGMSRADLARRLGLNRSSIGNIVGSLIAQSLVDEGGDAIRPADEGRTGRPGIMVKLSDDGAFFLGLEIGIDRLTAVLIDLSANIVGHRTVAFECVTADPKDVVARAAALASETVPAKYVARLRGACLTLPALMDTTGVVRNAPMLGWRDVPITRMLQDCLPFPVEVATENDANAFAIGESYIAGNATQPPTLYLNIENGVGGAIVIGGHLFRGAHGFAGEFGHLSVSVPQRQVRRGSSGELETLIGKDAVLDLYMEFGGKRDLDHLLRALAARDHIALKTAAVWADALSYGLAQVVKFFDPALIVLGGSVAPIYSYVAAQVDEYLASALVQGVPKPHIEVSARGGEGAAYGAACLMHQRLFSSGVEASAAMGS